MEYIKFLVLLILFFLTSCSQIRKEAYQSGYVDGKNDCLLEIESAKKEVEKQKAVNYGIENATRDFRYYFKLYFPDSKIVEKSLNVTKIDDNIFHIQVKYTASVDSQRYSITSEIYHLTYISSTEKYQVNRVKFFYKKYEYYKR